MIAKTNTALNKLQLSDIYSLMLFVLYNTKDVPEYKTLSELCYLLDGSNLNRILTYYAGKTIRFPTEEDMAILTNALLLYQYININGKSFKDAFHSLTDIEENQQQKITDLYIKLINIMANYTIASSKEH